MRLCLYMVSLKKAEEDVVAAQALMERKLHEALGDPTAGQVDPGGLENDLEIDVPSGKLIWFNMVLIWFNDGMIME